MASKVGWPKRQTSTSVLALGALGVVFGDIGTSPLYALRESLAGEHQLAVDETNVLGVLSLMFWSLILVVTVKYLLIVMRADNHGEGGILALTSLVTGRAGPTRILILCGLFGTALLYGDGMITPAISVLSAVEGLQVVAPSLDRWIVPIVAVILVGLFSIQHRGTEVIGRLFGPVMTVWFAIIALLGAKAILAGPAVLKALNPVHAVAFFATNRFEGFLALGSIFLVVTGGEALYADMGHFGRRPIQYGWFAVVLPALVLNYFGQGALLLADPTAIANPFFLLAPSWALWPLTALATFATVIASQALISGAFSLTSQAINMDYLPKMRVVQTSAHHKGQVYVPAINWFLLASCLGLVVAFRSSTRLAAAYGVAVTMTMVITTVLIAWVARTVWGWSKIRLTLVMIPLLAIDVGFASANVFKIPAGGWVPLLVGIAGFTIFTTWQTGRRLVADRLERRSLSLDSFVAGLRSDPPARHDGTGVYLHRLPGVVPAATLANLRYNRSLHNNVVFLSIITEDRPRVLPIERDRLTRLGDGFFQLEMHYGFADTQRLGDDLALLRFDDVVFDAVDTTYFLGRERIEAGQRPGMTNWRDRLFAFMSRNASDPSVHFALPRGRSVDIGVHVEI